MLKKILTLFNKSITAEKNLIEDSFVICLVIENINSIVEKLNPQDSVNWMRGVNSYVEAEAEKYGGVMASYNVGEVLLGIPLSSARLKTHGLEMLLENLPKEIARMYKKCSFDGNNSYFGVGVDSGICLISGGEKNLLAGEAVLNATTICRYAIASKERMLIANSVIEKCEALKGKTTKQGLIPGTNINTLKWCPEKTKS